MSTDLANTVVNIQISTGAPAVSAQGFGVLLFLAFHTHNTDWLRTYSDPNGLLADGFTANEPAMLFATKAFSQNPRPALVKIGRRGTPQAYTVNLTMLTNTTGTPITFTITASDGSETDVNYISTGSTLEDAANIVASFNADPVTVDYTQESIYSTAGSTLPETGRAVMLSVASGGALPSGLLTDTIYYVVRYLLNQEGGTQFQISGTLGGSLLPFNDNGGVFSALDAITGTAGSPGKLTSTAGDVLCTVGTPVVFVGSTLPAPLIAGDRYYIVSAVPDSEAIDFTVSYTLGGSPIAISSGGSGTMDVKYITGVCPLTARYIVTDVTIAQVSDTAVIEMSSTSGETVFDLSDMPNCEVSASAGIGFKDITADPGIAADLAAIQAVDGASWYGLATDASSSAQILAIAAWCEANGTHYYFADTSDSDAATLEATLHSLGYKRTGIQYLQNETRAYGYAANLAKMLCWNPGAQQFAFQDEIGTEPDENLGSLVETLANVAGSGSGYGNIYVPVGGVACTQTGIMVDGRPAGVQIFVDFLSSQMQARILQAMIDAARSNNPIQMTDVGLAQVTALILSQLSACYQGTPNPGLVTGSGASPLVKVASLSPSIVKAGGPVQFGFSALGTGVLNSISIVGTLSYTGQ